MAKARKLNGTKGGGAKRDVLQDLTDKIVAAIEQGIADPNAWQAPWHRLGFMAARNVVSGKRYRGANALIFSMAAEDAGALPLWASFNQWKAMGFSVRKGERSTWGNYWAVVKLTDRETGLPMLDKNGDQETRMRPMPFNVFHIGQVREHTVRYSGRIRKVQHDGPKTAALKARYCPKVAPTAIERFEHAEKILTAVGATTYWGGDKAFHDRADNSVHLPAPESFTSGEGLVSTWAHELVHWTGDPNRLNREKGKRFGDATYALEELVAEMGSAFTCQHLGTEPEPRVDHAQYMASWLGGLKNDKGFIYAAAKEAERAFEYMMAQAGEDLGDPTEGQSEATEEEAVAA